MRFFYNLLAYLATFPYAIYWTIRAVANPSYRPGFRQRFGLGHPKLTQSIWVHAVSVGEVVAAEPLIRALLQAYPGRALLVTTVTPTGKARVLSRFGDDVTHSYIPFETPTAVNRFFARTDPSIALILETEIWPNLYQGCGVRGIPLVLVSARISPRSVKSYRKLLPLFRETLSHGIVIAAQSEADADRFISLGASRERTRVTGNIKFDVELDNDVVERGRTFRRETFGVRPVWVAASTHEGEEGQILDAHRALLKLHHDLLLVLVPRHPERFQSVAELVARKHLALVRRTEHRPCEPSTQVFLCDTMGELITMYAACDIAFVGGSLVPIGGHNLLEPGALGLPILTGPHNFNAEDIARQFIDRGACRQVEGKSDLARVVAELLIDEGAAEKLGSASRAIIAENRGSLDQLMSLIRPFIATR
ncbi:MAG: lipid IV(A) 3-deoxy-D-manno-octulosonic acid transferase [Pseudomonadota bacterium]